jgi:hypothetical protein
MAVEMNARSVLQVAITDPATVALRGDYQCFIESTTMGAASPDAAVEGLILFALDEHAAFGHWRSLALRGSGTHPPGPIDAD